MGYLQGSDKRKNNQERTPRTTIRRISKYEYTVKEEIGSEGKSRKWRKQRSKQRPKEVLPSEGSLQEKPYSRKLHEM